MQIFPLYEDILQRLRKEEPNERTLCLLWKLFLSPIERPVPSKEAVKAFEVFWFATYHGKDILFEPELIRYLKGLDMVLGVGLAAGFTQSDDSQQTVSPADIYLIHFCDSTTFIDWFVRPRNAVFGTRSSDGIADT